MNVSASARRLILRRNTISSPELKPPRWKERSWHPKHRRRRLQRPSVNGANIGEEVYLPPRAGTHNHQVITAAKWMLARKLAASLS